MTVRVEQTHLQWASACDCYWIKDLGVGLLVPVCVKSWHVGTQVFQNLTLTSTNLSDSVSATGNLTIIAPNDHMARHTIVFGCACPWTGASFKTLSGSSLVMFESLWVRSWCARAFQSPVFCTAEYADLVMWPAFQYTDVSINHWGFGKYFCCHLLLRWLQSHIFSHKSVPQSHNTNSK